MRRATLLLVLLLPLLALLALGTAAQEQEHSPSFLERQLESLVPGLRVEGLQGTWRAAPRARRITLSDAQGVWLELQDVRLDLAPTSLVRGVLRLEMLEAQQARVERLPVPDPQAAPAPEAAPSDQVLPALPSLPVDVALDRLAVERLELGEAVAGQAAAFALDGKARLASGRLEAELGLRRLDAGGNAQVNLVLAPADDRLDATVTLREDPGGLVPMLLGQPDRPLDLDLRLAGPASGATLSVQAGMGSGIALNTQGTVRALSDGSYGAQLTGDAGAAPLLPPDLGPLAFPARFSLDVDRPAEAPIALRGLTVETPAGSADATGTLDLAREAPDLTARLRLQDSARFAALLPPGFAWESVQAEARVTGRLATPELRLQARPQGFASGIPQLDAVLGPAPGLALDAALPGPRLDARLEGAEGRLIATGTLAEPIALDARLSLPRLAVLGGGSEGALEARVQASGALADPDLVVTAESGRIAAAGRVLESLSLDARIATPATAPRGTATLEGRLDGMPLALLFRGQPEGSAVRIEQGEARLGPARLQVTGRLDPAGPVFDGRAQLEASDLAPLGRLGGVAGLAGRLSLEATLAPRDGQQGFEARLDAPRLGYNGTEGSLQATAAGTPSALDWTLQGRATEGAVSGRGRVAQENGGWRLDLAALEAQAMGEAVRLASPTRVRLGGDGGVDLAPTALAIARGGRIEARGRWGPERADLTATIAALPLALAERFVPDIQPQGTLSAELRATGPVARPEIRAKLTGTGLGAGAAWAQGLPALTLRAEGSLLGEAAQLRADLEAGPAGRLTANARLPGGFGPRGPVTATLDGNLNLAPLASPFLAAGADRVTGRVALALRADGTVGEPRLGGRATLSGAEYRNTAYGVRVFDLNGTLTGDGTRLVIERIAGRTAGNGTLELRGSLDAGAPGFPADLILTARNARPVVSDLVTATIGADLRMQGPVTGGGTLSGDVRIQRAEIRIPQTLPASVPRLENVRQTRPLPPGVIPPDPPAPPAAPAPPINLAVTVSAPQGIFVRGRGVEVELGGEVRVGGTLAEPVPSGGLTLRRGTLDLVGRLLTFQRGSIDFASGTLVPRLDLTAQSRAGSTTILVNVEGPPNDPKVTFTSTPELPQDEVLARLLFDRPTSNLSPFEIAQIAAAVAQLTGVGGGAANPLDKVRGLLGLDRLGVTSGQQAGQAAGQAGGQQGPTVEAGRYVAPGVFLGIRQGTQGGQTGVGVQVEITPRLKLEGQTATGPAGDRLGLSYEFEY
ncbi:translocation/assembly module TamB domain-containing protein [Roseicella aerolata]|uniref:Translocation/assembly module TamB domain-containing protein n=1 Tax=Roseicella aerolata TaxID=2883479 RepID=A0A9X1IA87_9PROT|nr:translocation/assembly module TamB domain-containing protein [Roseicella aerolata]MCB4821100.1 translocation/assembly module TamB domain-containing protein [Roseicella aerolata]